MQINVAVDRLLACFDCDSQEVTLFFCLHQSATMTYLMTKISVDQCSLHGCANVSLW